MELYAHQKDFLSENPDKSSLIWSCGTAKSRTALEWVKLSPRGGRPLVICPKALKINWQREADLWGGNPYILSKEEFRAQAKTLPYFSSVIVDEVHNGFLTPNFKSQMSKSLRYYLDHHHVPRVLLLTATPYTSNPWNIFNLGYYTGHEFGYQVWKRTFFTDVRMGARIVPVPKKGMEPRLAKIVQSIASVVNIYDVMDVPLQHHTSPEYFALNPQQISLIQNEAYDPLPIVRYTKQHEIENGVLIDHFPASLQFPIDKLDRLLSLVEENPKIAIVCRYNTQIDAVKAYLEQHVPNIPIFIIRGDVPNRDLVTRQAEEAQHAVVLIQADCNAGYELPSIPVVVFASMSYSYVAWEQMQGRFLRMNKPSRTTFLYLLTEGDSIDKAVYNAVKRKEDFSAELHARTRFSKDIRPVGEGHAQGDGGVRTQKLPV